MKKLRPLIWLFLTGSMLQITAQNAPISTVGDEVTTGTSVVVPITAVNFTNVASCNLQLVYNPSIATCTGVTKGSVLPGGLSINISTPGLIRFGWYNFPGVTLPDNSIIFNLTFTKVSGGTSYVAWDETYADRQWSDGDFFPLNDLPFEDFYHDGSVTFQTDAPITIAPEITACPGNIIDIPVTVQNFNDIGALSLTLHFNASALQFQSYTNNSSFPGLGVLNPNTGVITAAGFSTTTGITIPYDGVLFTLHFLYIGGTTNLTWFDDGESCEYTGPPFFYEVLNDSPTSAFYINGEVTESCISEWTGNVDDDWFKTGNWTQGVPYNFGDAIIPLVDPNPYPVIEGNAICRDADIASGASLTIQATGTLSVLGDISNDGELIIKSSATGTGSLIHSTPGVNAKVERYLTSSLWHYTSIPVSNAMSFVFLDIYLRTFDEPTYTWNPWIIPTNIPLEVMLGYAAWVAGTTPATVTYSGLLNTGSQSISVTRNSSLDNPGWNLVGNPFPSALDWDAASGWDKSSVDNTIYFYRGNSGQSNYKYYIGAGGGTPSVGVNEGTNQIPAMQGFFIQATGDGVLSVNNNARIHSSQEFWKKTETNDIPIIRLKAELNGLADETVVRFFPGASLNFDNDKDAYKLFGNGHPQIYSITPDQTELAVSTLPDYNDETMVPVGFIPALAGL
ncbi:MAG: cohesin domain-containing protein, partial [Bacteroidales bacterium]